LPEDVEALEINSMKIKGFFHFSQQHQEWSLGFFYNAAVLKLLETMVCWI
jgi:hypothetical protein